MCSEQVLVANGYFRCIEDGTKCQEDWCNKCAMENFGIEQEEQNEEEEQEEQEAEAQDEEPAPEATTI